MSGKYKIFRAKPVRCWRDDLRWTLAMPNGDQVRNTSFERAVALFNTKLTLSSKHDPWPTIYRRLFDFAQSYKSSNGLSI